MSAYPAPPFDAVRFVGLAAITPVVALLAASKEHGDCSGDADVNNPNVSPNETSKVYLRD